MFKQHRKVGIKMEEMMMCQSCGKPLEKEEEFGTNKDGSMSKDFCLHCYQKGEFTDSMSMEEMIQYCVDHMKEWGIPSTEEAFRQQLNTLYPTLKRWHN